MMKKINISLPWPPSANTYWRRNGARYFISPKGIIYRNFVVLKCLTFKDYFDKSDRLKLHIDAYPPDKRIRDLDNLFKSTIDSLQFAKLFPNDSQIDELSIKRMDEKLSKIEIIITEK